MICPACGTDETYETTSLGEAARRYLCRNGHRFIEVEFRPWTGLPGGGVFCGPAATVRVPTPEEILRHAEGLGVLTA